MIHQMCTSIVYLHCVYKTSMVGALSELKWLLSSLSHFKHVSRYILPLFKKQLYQDFDCCIPNWNYPFVIFLWWMCIELITDSAEWTLHVHLLELGCTVLVEIGFKIPDDIDVHGITAYSEGG